MTSSSSSSRRKFLKGALGAGAAASGLAACRSTGPYTLPPPSRGAYLGGFRTAPLERVRLGFIGVGARGPGHVMQMMMMEGTDIVAICDNHAPAAERMADRVAEAGRPRPATYTDGDWAFKDMLAREDLDAVVIATPWEWHARMGVEAMKAGAHAFIEVPIAPTIDEQWELVDTAEQYRKHCMMMENVCYGREELLFLHLCRLGLVGELLHGEGAYIHDLRGQMMELERGTGSWRTTHHTYRDGNLYPTHGLGPIAQYMGCERGEDRFDHLVSMSSPARGRALHAQRSFPADHYRNKADYVCGDMNTSLIQTARGRTIMVQHDTTTPRPYSRLNLIAGTKGTLAGFPTRIALEKDGEGAHGWVEGEGLDDWYSRYEHPLYTRVGEEAVKAGGHGGMDFIMLWRIIYCLRNGEPMDQNVYEGCAWSAVAPLSEWSVAHGGAPCDFPDFTRGRWRETERLDIVS